MQKSEIDNNLVTKTLSYDSNDPGSLCCSDEHLVCYYTTLGNSSRISYYYEKIPSSVIIRANSFDT